MARLDRENLDVYGLEGDQVLFLHRWNGTDRLFCVFNFNLKQMDMTISSNAAAEATARPIARSRSQPPSVVLSARPQAKPTAYLSLLFTTLPPN